MISDAPDDGFARLLGTVERERGFSCGSYKTQCLRRRVNMRMRSKGLTSVHEYVSLIESDARELDKLVSALTINVTRFFRNAPVWDAVARQVVPDLWRSELPEIHVWSAGCASGEEALTAAILFHREAAVSGMLGQVGRLAILGSDVDMGALQLADAGEYGEADLAEVPPDLRQRYFTPQAPFLPASGVRRLVRFARHDLLGVDYPATPQHLIICRNVLIYFDRPSQERVLEQFYQSLAPGGYLILGKVETLLGMRRGRFAPVAQRERIFRKVS